jgi:hypothetical protein
MQLRFLKRAGSRQMVWPPTEGGRYGLPDSPQLRETGVLAAVSRIGHRLSVTIEFEGGSHVALLSPWVEPPTIEQVHAALRRAIGRRVSEVGEIDIDRGDGRDDHGY